MNNFIKRVYLDAVRKYPRNLKTMLVIERENKIWITGGGHVDLIQRDGHTWIHQGYDKLQNYLLKGSFKNVSNAR